METIIDNRILRKTRGDKIVSSIFLLIGFLCASFIVIIVGFILVKGISPFFIKYNDGSTEFSINFINFIFGNSWNENTDLSVAYGVGFVIINTVYVTLLSLLFAVPLSVASALFIVRIAPKPLSIVINTCVELLASIPSIVYGVFGMGVINPIVNGIANSFGIQTPGGRTALSIIFVLTIMIYPTITMVSITAIKSVKTNVIDGSLALGASMTETNFKVVLTSAKSGIFAGIILGVGRVLGEATAISLVCSPAGSGPNFNLFDSTRTLTTTMLSGIHETTGVDYDIRFSVAVVLIIIILATNLILNQIKKRIGRLS